MAPLAVNSLRTRYAIRTPVAVLARRYTPSMEWPGRLAAPAFDRIGVSSMPSVQGTRCTATGWLRHLIHHRLAVSAGRCDRQGVAVS